MVDSSAGKKLSAARLSRGLSIDEAAHATKMRPDKILALENDDYSRFGNAAYAKGFLLIYSRFLGVEVGEQLRDFEHQEVRVNVADYQYLSNVVKPEDTSSRIPLRRLETRRPPSILPLVLFVLLAAMAGGIYYIIVMNARLVAPPPATMASSLAGTSAGAGSLAPSAAPAEGARPSVSQESSPEVALQPQLPSRPETASALPSAVAPAAPATAAEQPENINELIVEPLKKAWVKIRKDTPDSAPIFEGDLYPGFRPLKLKGTRFFVEVRDQSTVQIRKNGLPIAYQSPGISIP